jgi:hypothetical protein
VRAFPEEAPQLGDPQAPTIGLQHVIGPQTIDGDDDEGNGSLGVVGGGEGEG